MWVKRKRLCSTDERCLLSSAEHKERGTPHMLATAAQLHIHDFQLRKMRDLNSDGNGCLACVKSWVQIPEPQQQKCSNDKGCSPRYDCS